MRPNVQASVFSSARFSSTNTQPLQNQENCKPKPPPPWLQKKSTLNNQTSDSNSGVSGQGSENSNKTAASFDSQKTASSAEIENAGIGDELPWMQSRTPSIEMVPDSNSSSSNQGTKNSTVSSTTPAWLQKASHEMQDSNSTLGDKTTKYNTKAVSSDISTSASKQTVASRTSVSSCQSSKIAPSSQNSKFAFKRPTFKPPTAKLKDPVGNTPKEVSTKNPTGTGNCK